MMPDFYYQIQDLFRNTYTGRIVTNFFQLMIIVGPFFLVSIFLNVIIRSFLIKKQIKFKPKNEPAVLLIAGVLGLVSPFPTYIAVPMGMSFVAAGLPAGAIVAFMISSPLMNPGIFILTLSQLGWEIALSRVISAYLLAITAGFLSGLIWKQLRPRQPIDSEKVFPSKRPVWMEFKRSLLFLGKYFGIALFLSAVVKALVPAEMIGRLLGGHANMSLVIAVAMGVPFYSCGGAAIPLVQVLSEMGMNKGAVLAFFIAGPSTKLETIYVYKSMLGVKFLLLYLGFMFLGATLSGFILLNI